MLKRLLALYKRELIDFYQGNRLIICLSALYVLLKIPSLFEPYWYGDEGVSLTVGMAIRKGYLLYRDVFDNKPPLLYLIASLANGNLFVFRLFFFFWGILGLQLFYRISIFLFTPKKQGATIISNIAFIILTTTPIFEANIANGEVMFIVFSLAGWYFTLAKKGYLKAGLMFSFAFLTKVPAVFDLWPLVVWLIASVKLVQQLNKSGVVKLLLAFSVPIILSFLFFSLHGEFFSYLSSVYVQMIGYSSSWGTGNQQLSLVNLLKSGLVIKGSVLMLFGFIFWRQWKGQKGVIVPSLFAYWLISSIFGATISGRPYPHYLVQVVPPLCFSLGFIALVKPRQKFILIMGIFLLVGTFKYYNFWQYPSLSYYVNFFKLVTKGEEGKESYYKFFNPSLPEQYTIASIVQAYSENTDKIYVWSNTAQFYPMTKRLPVLKYVTAYHLIEKGEDQKVETYIQIGRAKVIVNDKKLSQNDRLMALLNNNYYLVESLSDYDIFVIK